MVSLLCKDRGEENMYVFGVIKFWYEIDIPKEQQKYIRTFQLQIA